MRIIAYNEKESRRNWTVLIILFSLLLIQSGIITFFSGQVAEKSADLSRDIMNKMEWVPEFIPREAESGKSPVFTLHYIIRKMAHFYNFFIIGLLLMASRAYMEKGIWRDILWAALGLGIAVIDEVHQYFVPGRSAEVFDVLVDFSGVIFGMCFLKVLWEIIFKKRCKV